MSPAGEPRFFRNGEEEEEEGKIERDVREKWERGDRGDLPAWTAGQITPALAARRRWLFVEDGERYIRNDR